MDTELSIDVNEIAEDCRKLSEKERQQVKGIVIGMRLAREAAGQRPIDLELEGSGTGKRAAIPG